MALHASCIIQYVYLMMEGDTMTADFLEQELTNVCGVLGALMSVISFSADGDDTITPSLMDDVYFSIRAVRCRLEHLIDAIPAEQIGS